jgi:hypothetical protein
MPKQQGCLSSYEEGAFLMINAIMLQNSEVLKGATKKAIMTGMPHQNVQAPADFLRYNY